jgi:phospholipid/cholesterol/gamma-HCH transport system substrate-binding protein
MTRTFRLGVFIVGTLGVLALGIFLIGDKQLLFSSTYRLKASFKNVAGLNNGADVRVGGIHKGTVRMIQLPAKSTEDMTVVMQLEKSTRRVIKKDSVAEIQTEGLMGDKYVEISFGSDGVPSVEDGDTIASEPPMDISDLIRKTNGILDSAKESSDSLRDISSKINQGQGTLGALVNDKNVYDRLNAATEQAKSGATAFQENMQALKSNFFLRGFFNRRGYQDSAELAKYEIARLPEGQPLKTFSYRTDQVFQKPDTAKLKNEKTLNEAGQFLQANPFGAAVIVAATGMKGDSEKNHVLTQARAMVVRDYLVSNFQMDDTRIKTMGLGKNNAAAGDGSGDRLEIIIYTPGSKIPEQKDLTASKQ